MSVQTTNIEQYLKENKNRLIKTSLAIHANPEIGNEEYFACEQLTEILIEQDFRVETNVAGHETAFYAEYDSGKPGPTICYLAEYDALPGIGHACGHNIIGTTSVGAAIALSKELHHTGGKVVVFGTPAEEGGPNGSAKGSFVRHGYLKNVDVALMAHPSGKTGVTSNSLAVDPLDFKFYGKPAHASGAPEKGINALDAVILLFNGISAFRQQLPTDVRIHGIITDGGDAPNIIPQYAAARFFIRASTWKRTTEVSQRIRNIAEGAALSTGATVEIERFQNEVKDFVITDALDQVVKQELEFLGETVEEKRGSGAGSTDAGNISYEVPTAHPYIKIGDDLIGHTAEFREAAKSKRGMEALLIGAEALAKTGIQLLTNEQLLAEVKRSHKDALEQKLQQ